MKYIYSQLSSETVLQLVQLHYKSIAPGACKFYVLGLHDNYLIESATERFIFRIYRNDWRSEEEIDFELALLSYLQQRSVNVAAPVLSKASELKISAKFPEGERFATLFNFADGDAPVKDTSLTICESLGKSVANIHEQTRLFKTQYARPILDFSLLLDRSLLLIEPFINPEQLSYLKEISLKIVTNTLHLNAENSDYGVCVGDINFSNFHINYENRITHFDFDQCGYGYRVFELGKFSSSLTDKKLKHDRMTAFMRGYESVRSLSDIEKVTIPYFELAALIWVMSIHVSNANRIGYKYLDNQFWIRRIELLERVEATLA